MTNIQRYKSLNFGIEIGWIYLTIYFLFWGFSVGIFKLEVLRGESDD